MSAILKALAVLIVMMELGGLIVLWSSTGPGSDFDADGVLRCGAVREPDH